MVELLLAKFAASGSMRTLDYVVDGLDVLPLELLLCDLGGEVDRGGDIWLGVS